MTQAVRIDALVTPKQLAAYTTVGTSAVQPWVSDANGAAPATSGVVLQLDASAGPGTYIEYGGPSITPGNGLQLFAGDSALVPVANGAAVWIVPSAAGLRVRGQVQ